MGTRGLVGVKIDGRYHGTYNHFDSYPDGLGDEVILFVKNHLNTREQLASFTDLVRKVKWVDAKSKPPKKIQERYLKEGFADLSVSTRSANEWYCLLRKVQGMEALAQINAGKLEHLVENIDFVKDSLFCEYAYILNLDEQKIEFYKGFAKQPQPGNPFGEERGKDHDGSQNEYYPCSIVGTTPILDINPDWKAEFYKEEEEEAAEDEEKASNSEFEVVARLKVFASTPEEAQEIAAATAIRQWTIEIEPN